MDNKTEQEIYLESDGIQNVDEPEGGDLGSNTVSTAIELQPSVWTDGRIIYPEGEVWYKFTPSVSGYYTIYTIGDSDTVGFLYDAEQNLLMDADDNGVATNFKLVYNLVEGNTYYIKVMICGNEIGDFSIAVTNTVWVESVTVSDETLTINKGETLALTATVLPSYATNKAVRWGSSNADIVEVNTFTGEITAKGRGTARICALSQDGSAKMSCCEVTVNVLVDSVTVEPAPRVMHVGAQEQFTATVLPLDANNPLLRWHSSDTTVAAVNEASGCVTARAVGTVNIYATAQDGSGKQGVCAVTVLPAVPVQGIVMCPDTHTMNVGESAYLSYDIYPADATNKTLTWYSSDPNVAEVDLSTGEITAKRAGTTTITATTNDGSFSASCAVEINQVLTYPDILITHEETRQKILQVKTLIDENEKAYLDGRISPCTRDLVFEQLTNEYDIIRADYIVAGDNPFSDYTYALLGGDTHAEIPFPFSNNLTLNSTGLAVVVVQRALEVMGYYDPKESQKYGIFDTNTYDAACSWLPLMQYDETLNQYVFNQYSFNHMFQVSTKKDRTFDSLTELNKFRTVHNIVAKWSSDKVKGTYRMKDNKITNGNVSKNYYGYADVLKETNQGTYIWEVKPDKEQYYRKDGIGERQLNRYFSAAEEYDQLFSKPLKIGYNIGEFTIRFLSNKYIDVRQFISFDETDRRNALILYKVEAAPHYTLESDPVFVDEPSESYSYNRSYHLNTETLGSIAVTGIAVVLGIACIALASSTGGVSLLPLAALAA